MRKILCGSILVVVVLGGSAALDAKRPPKPRCKDVCYAYGQLIAQERVKPEQEGYQYLAPTSNPVVAKIRTIPFDQGGNNPPIDDELYLVVKSTEPGSNAQKEIWRINYPDPNPAERAFQKDVLYPGRNELAVWYRNTAGPNAHFFAKLGGTAFGGTEDYSTAYKEGLSFGAGNPPYLISRLQGFGVVRSGKVFVSRVVHPMKETGCTCAGLP